MEKGLPNDEMEKLMMTHIVVKEDDLRLLAMKRAEVVSDAIMEEGEFDAGRVFVVEPKTLEPEAEKGRQEEPRRFQVEISGSPVNQDALGAFRCARFALMKMTMPKNTKMPPEMSCRISSPSVWPWRIFMTALTMATIP